MVFTRTALCYSAATSHGPVSVCLSVCLFVTSQSSIETGERIVLVLGMGASFDHPMLSCKKIRVSPKITALPSGTLSDTPDLENFATAYRSFVEMCYQLSSAKVDVNTLWTVAYNLNFFTKRHTTTVIFRLTVQTLTHCLETQFTPPDTTQTGPSCRVWRAV